MEYAHASEDWKPCLRGDAAQAGDAPYTQPVCDIDAPTPPTFDCGGGQTGTFEIRASQGERTAGPVEIKTRMKNTCAYDDKTLYHELTLDLP